MKRSPLTSKTPLKRTGFKAPTEEQMLRRKIRKKDKRHKIEALKRKPTTGPKAGPYSQKRNRSVKRHGYASYQAYMKSPEWRAFRDRAYAAWGTEECLVCGRTPVALHHINYERVCQEEPWDVVPLCTFHHEAIHCYHQQTSTPVSKIREALQYVTGRPMAEVDLALRRLDEMRAEGI